MQITTRKQSMSKIKIYQLIALIACFEMKTFIKFLFLIICTFGVLVSASEAKTPVLVELYTSEGCPTCPPADKNLIYLEQNQPVEDVEIITLALHVDYWNTRGWNDQYSSPIFSRRQEIYSMQFKINGTFTPQMVVNGEYQFPGSRLEEATQTIGKAAKNALPETVLSFEDEKLKVKIPNLPNHKAATVYLAIAESGLSGKRRTNSAHASVVRELKSLAMLDASKQNYDADVYLQFQPEWKKENLKYVVFVQENYSRKVLTVNQIKAE